MASITTGNPQDSGHESSKSLECCSGTRLQQVNVGVLGSASGLEVTFFIRLGFEAFQLTALRF